jgi:hypothetical protein
MADLKNRILAGLASDPSISTRGISLEVSSKGFLQKKKILRVQGSVLNGAEKDRVLKLAQEQAGDEYEIMDHLFVSEILWDG